MKVFAIELCSLLLLVSGTEAASVLLFRRDANSSDSPQVTFSGDGTYYGANRGQSGACALYDPIPPPETVDVVAMNTPQWAGGSLCGACVSITGSLGSAVARVVDRCPACAFGALDLSEELFPKIDDPSKGRVLISWNFVPCPDSIVNGSVSYWFQVGSTVDWFAFQVRNHRLAISSVEISTDGASWKGLERTDDNFFKAIGVGAGPYSIRISAVDGQKIVDSGITLSPGTLVPGTVQFEC